MATENGTQGTTPQPSPLQDRTNTQSEELAVKDKQIQRLQRVVKGFVTKRGRGRKKRGRSDSDNEKDDQGSDNDGDSATPSKKTKTDDDDGSDHIHAGRMISRYLGPFVDIAEVANHGIQLDGAAEGEDVDEIPRLADAWRILWGRFPQLREEFLMLCGQPMVLRATMKQMMSGAVAARQQDTGTVKTGIPAWLAKDSTTPLTPPLAQPKNKALRGMMHPTFAALLTPMEWEATSQTYDDITQGRKTLTGSQLPRFLFPLEQVFPVGTALSDPAWLSVFDNVCKGEVLLRAAKAIYMGPDAALQADGYHKGRAGNARIIKMATFTPRIIAGVATQVYFGLSSLPEWNKKDGEFDYEDFFWTIHELFDDDEEWSKEIIALWDRVVLGTVAKADDAPVDSGPSALEQLKANKAAAKAARAAATAATSTSTAAPPPAPAASVAPAPAVSVASAPVPA